MALLLIKPVYSADNLIKPEIADLGAWTNESNIQLFKTNITKDMEAFQPKAQSVQTIEDYVPIEAKVGLAFMNALSFIGDIIDNSLGRFIIIFIIIAYIFWAAFETYNMMTKDGNAMELVQNLLKRAVILSICIIILIQGPAELFMMIIGVGGCTALILLAFGLQDSMDAVSNKQYEDIVLYDAMAAPTQGLDTLNNSYITKQDAIYYDTFTLNDYTVKVIGSDEILNDYFGINIEGRSDKFTSNDVLISKLISKDFDSFSICEN